MFNCFQVHAEDTHEIEPSILEIHYSASYDADMKKSPYMRGNNIYILRCGKKQSQYFCYENLRHDSLSSVPGGNKILYDEYRDVCILSVWISSSFIQSFRKPLQVSRQRVAQIAL